MRKTITASSRILHADSTREACTSLTAGAFMFALTAVVILGILAV